MKKTDHDVKLQWNKRAGFLLISGVLAGVWLLYQVCCRYAVPEGPVTKSVTEIIGAVTVLVLLSSMMRIAVNTICTYAPCPVRYSRVRLPKDAFLFQFDGFQSECLNELLQLFSVLKNRYEIDRLTKEKIVFAAVSMA